VELNTDKDGAAMRGRELQRNGEEAQVQQIRFAGLEQRGRV